MRGPRPRAVEAARLLAGLAFAVTGAVKLLRHDVAAQDFARWGVPLAEPAVVAVGLLELAGGLVLASARPRAAVRIVAALLAADMLAALLLAGTQDGGVHVAAPVALGVVCALVAARRT